MRILSQAEQYPWRIGAAPMKIYRGYQLDLPEDLEREIQELNRLPEEPGQVGQHLRIGPKLLDYLAGRSQECRTH